MRFIISVPVRTSRARSSQPQRGGVACISHHEPAGGTNLFTPYPLRLRGAISCKPARAGTRIEGLVAREAVEQVRPFGAKPIRNLSSRTELAPIQGPHLALFADGRGRLLPRGNERGIRPVLHPFVEVRRGCCAQFRILQQLNGSRCQHAGGAQRPFFADR